MDPGSLALWLATTALNAVVAYATAPDFNNVGPRLDDTNVVGSRYGAAIPIVHGRARVPGNIVWAPPLREEVTTAKQRAGKGSTVTTTTYAYYGTFAVLLCVGDPALRPLRIWADKKLLWTAPNGNVHLSGTLDGGGSWEFAPGSATQSRSAIMAQVLGINNTPAYRHRAMLYVSDLPVDQFGRRVPQIEVELARGVPTAAAVLANVLGDLFARHGLAASEVDLVAATAEFDGIAINAGGTPQLLDALLVAQSLQMVNTGERLAVREIDSTTIAATIQAAELVISSDAAPFVTRRVREDALPREVRLRYLDRERDYQVAVQSASTQLGGSVGVLDLDLPAVWTAAAARAACDVVLRRAVIGRAQFGPFVLPPKYLFLEPGDVIRVVMPDRTHTIRLTQLTIGANGAIECIGEAYRASVLTGVGDGGDSGQFTGQQPQDFGTGTLHVFDAPALADEDASRAGLWWAAAGTGPSWRGSVLEASVDNGDTWTAVDTIGAPSIIGSTVSALAAPAYGAHRVDTATVDVQLVRGQLQSVSRAALLAGANVALIGDELIQFEVAEYLGGNTYRLRGLLRGRRGTEHLMGSVAAGARFVLLHTAKFLPTGAASIGATRKWRVVPAGSATAHGQTTATIGSASVRPWSPVHVRGTRSAGDLTIAWTTRSRVGTELPDGGIDARDEPDDLHTVQILAGANVVRSFEVAGTSVQYTAAMQTTDFGAPQASIDVRIRRRGQYAASPWTAATL